MERSATVLTVRSDDGLVATSGAGKVQPVSGGWAIKLTTTDMARDNHLVPVSQTWRRQPNARDTTRFVPTILGLK